MYNLKEHFISLKVWKRFFSIVAVCILSWDIPVFSQSPTDIKPMLDSYNVAWDVPGPTSSQSMPIGNGDIGLNVWVEPNGDLCFLISKTDSWGAPSPTEKNNWIKDSGVLMKLGKVRISVTPNPLAQGKPFIQTLKLRTGEILVKEGDLQFKVWVDANHPVIRVETQSTTMANVKVTLNNWRWGNGDVLAKDQATGITWYHQNPKNTHAAIQNMVFGATIKGKNLIAPNDTTLQSRSSVKTQLISIYPLTTNNKTTDEWLAQMNKQAQQNDALNLELTRTAHQQWWNKFWHRSWIFINGDEAVKKVNQGYILQRFVTACAGRGAYPIKFNGSIFVVDNPQYKVNSRQPTGVAIDADYREWGGQYWFQNTRHMYWPRLMAGDFDEMLPLFNMYSKILPVDKAQVKEFYKHDGGYIGETASFWGGIPYAGPDAKESWVTHYYTPILELSMMMLDYYDYTGDKKFAKETLLPMASAGILFFDKHFSRDAQGKLLLDPDNSIEEYWKVQNPTPDIAGLHVIINRLLALPNDLTDAASRANWKRFYSELPELPTGTDKNGGKVVLPYTGPQTARTRNSENPELYTIFPFRIYGLGKPEVETAINTFNARKYKNRGCWVQDAVQAAMLGLTDIAKDDVAYILTNKSPILKFPAFWATGNDYAPDQDNGGNGENGLQNMLMQTEGKKILLLPAWPKEWEGDFKLNAPFRTTVQGTVSHGKIINLIVTPKERAADVINMAAIGEK
jgi:alpha-L-fucosidase 2